MPLLGAHRQAYKVGCPRSTFSPSLISSHLHVFYPLGRAMNASHILRHDNILTDVVFAPSRFSMLLSTRSIVTCVLASCAYVAFQTAKAALSRYLLHKLTAMGDLENLARPRGARPLSGTAVVCGGRCACGSGRLPCHRPLLMHAVYTASLDCLLHVFARRISRRSWWLSQRRGLSQETRKSRYNIPRGLSTTTPTVGT